MSKKEIYVVGHKNPDTDSICSAIAYANLKNKIEKEEKIFVPKRAGELNEETQHVLKLFDTESPELLENVKLQVADIDMSKMEGVPSSTSIKEAWLRMKKENMTSLPILKGKKLEGMITTGNIATSYLDIYDSDILSKARTQYKSIVNTIDGTLITGNEHGYFIKGKVVISASSPDIMENIIEENDLIILGNRYESQLSALEMDVSCIVVCQGADISKTIKKIATQRDIVIISTPHDTFTIARLINQSIPVKCFMESEDLTIFTESDYVDEIRDVITKQKSHDFPVIDEEGNYSGLISRRRMMNASPKRVILVDHNEKNQAVQGIEEARILEIIDHHRIGNLETKGPVYFRNQPVGCTATIVYQLYQEAGVEMDKVSAGLLCAAIISDTLMFRSPTCTMLDEIAAKELARIAELEIEEFAKKMFRAGSNLKKKTPIEILNQDFKEFHADNIHFGVGQINSMSEEELEEIKKQLEPYLEKALQERGLKMVFFMLTNILTESTELLCVGNRAKEYMIEAFGLKEDTKNVILPGMMSRKKQLVPTFLISLQQ